MSAPSLGHAALKVDESARAQLDKLVAGLREALGETLVSVLVHGSSVRGGWVAGQSDVDVLVVLRSAELAQLEAMANALRVARNAARVECMILTVDDIARAADAFPVFYADLQRTHALLHGEDPFASLELHDEHLRLRVEQELREVQIRLRRAVTDTTGGPRQQLAGALHRKVRQLRGPLYALLRLERAASAATSDSLESVYSLCEARYHVPAAPLLAPAKDPAAAYDALAKLLHRTVEAVDKLVLAPARSSSAPPARASSVPPARREEPAAP